MSEKIKAIIIDDMELARASLKADLSDYCPNVEVVGEADGVLSGAKLLKQITPDILFLDIEMEDGDGFDLIDILPDSLESIIFVTAKENFALKAFQYSAVDYLLKPVDPELLKKAVDKMHNRVKSTKGQYALLKQNMKEDAPLDKLALHTSDKIVVAPLTEIVRLEAMTNYTYFHFLDGSKLLITKTLKEYDNMLSDSGFVRVHQSHLINMQHVKAYVKSEGGYILMKNDQIVPVSVRKKSYVVNLLG
ncbi:MAG: LytTR family DNA-binding domain-containing protein [Saprospiraceae bacterium]|nr:LytTR family DNA-binding domain-containing protein [Saprospiraceae bacterium]